MHLCKRTVYNNAITTKYTLFIISFLFSGAKRPLQITFVRPTLCPYYICPMKHMFSPLPGVHDERLNEGGAATGVVLPLEVERLGPLQQLTPRLIKKFF